MLVLVIDATSMPKKGKAPVAVSLRNMLRALGKTANCPELVSTERWRAASAG